MSFGLTPILLMAEETTVVNTSDLQALMDTMVELKQTSDELWLLTTELLTTSKSLLG